MRLAKLFSLALMLIGGCIPRHGFGVEAIVYVSSAADDLTQEAKEFVKTHSDEKAEAKWLKKTKDLFQDMIKDNDAISSDQKAADICLFDFLADNRKRFEQTEKLTDDDRLALCRWYLLYRKSGWDFPPKIVPYLNRANYDRWFPAGKEVAE